MNFPEWADSMGKPEWLARGSYGRDLCAAAWSAAQAEVRREMAEKENPWGGLVEYPKSPEPTTTAEYEVDLLMGGRIRGILQREGKVKFHLANMECAKMGAMALEKIGYDARYWQCPDTGKAMVEAQTRIKPAAAGRREGESREFEDLWKPHAVSSGHTGVTPEMVDEAIRAIEASRPPDRRWQASQQELDKLAAAIREESKPMDVHERAEHKRRMELEATKARLRAMGYEVDEFNCVISPKDKPAPESDRETFWRNAGFFGEVPERIK